MGNIGTEQKLIEVLPAGVPESEAVPTPAERVVAASGEQAPEPVPTPLR